VLPAPRGSDNPAAQTGDPALPFERPAKSNILHQRNVWVAAQALKDITPDKQRLITRADFGHAGAIADHPADQFEQPVLAFELDGARLSDAFLAMTAER